MPGSKQHKRQLHQAREASAVKFSERLNALLQQRQQSGVLAYVPSSDGNRKYAIKLASDHTVFCECQGWQYSKETPKTCRHLKRFKAQMRPQEIA